MDTAQLKGKNPPNLNLQAGAPVQRATAPVQRAKSAEEKVLDRVKGYDQYIEEAAATYGIPVTQIRSLIAVESAGRSDASSGAAWGLMQITKGTWGDTQGRFPELARYDFDSYWDNPRINIMFGVATFKTKMKTVGVGTDDANFASLAITAYNAGEGTVRYAIRNATNAGSQNPTADALKPEYLKPAIERTRIYRYYLTGRGKRYNKSGTVEEAVELKFKEVSRYPDKVQRYLALQNDGGQNDQQDNATDSSNSESSDPIGTGVITAQGLNVRTGPGTSFGKAGNPLTQDASVTIYAEQDGWYKIGDDRWISGKHVAMTETQPEQQSDQPIGSGKITASALNVRSGPGTGFGKVGEALRKDADITIYAEQDGWYNIGEDRWVSARYVEMTAAPPQNEQSSGPIDTGTVSTGALNVRSGPGGTHDKAGDPLTRGSKVDVFEKKDGWLRIGEDLWVSGRFVELGSQTGGGQTDGGQSGNPTPAPTEKKGFVVASSLNVRSGIGTGSPIVRRLTRNQQVVILEERDGWVRISDNEWVSGKFIQPGEPNRTGAGMGPKPRWISVAESEIGQKEIKGSRHNPRVIEYHATTGRFGTDEVPWCASFANWVMRQAGQPETGSALAMSFANYGTRLNRPAYGALAVFSYGGGKGHVGFVVGKQGDRILVLGGNQSDSVKISSFSTSKIHSYVVPEGYEVPAEAYNLGGSGGEYEDGGGVAATR